MPRARPRPLSVEQGHQVAAAGKEATGPRLNSATNRVARVISGFQRGGETPKDMVVIGVRSDVALALPWQSSSGPVANPP